MQYYSPSEITHLYTVIKTWDLAAKTSGGVCLLVLWLYSAISPAGMGTEWNYRIAALIKFQGFPFRYIYN